MTVTLISPALGGVLVATVGASVTIAVDAATFLAPLWAAATLPRAARASGQAAARVKLRSILRRPLIAWLLALTVVFYGLSGPFETALPLSSATWAAGLPSMAPCGHPSSRRCHCLRGGRPRTVEHVERFALAVVAGWGLCVILVGATRLPVVAALGMAAGGLIYAPYPAITTTSLQRLLPSRELAAGAAGWFAILAAVTPATTAVGGPIVAAIGPRAAVLGSGIATIALALLVTAVHHRSSPRQPRSDQCTARPAPHSTDLCAR